MDDSAAMALLSCQVLQYILLWCRRRVVAKNNASICDPVPDQEGRLPVCTTGRPFRSKFIHNRRGNVDQQRIFSRPSKECFAVHRKPVRIAQDDSQNASLYASAVEAHISNKRVFLPLSTHSQHQVLHTSFGYPFVHYEAL